jgi:hypothetical protein
MMRADRELGADDRLESLDLLCGLCEANKSAQLIVIGQCQGFIPKRCSLADECLR